MPSSLQTSFQRQWKAASCQFDAGIALCMLCYGGPLPSQQCKPGKEQVPTTPCWTELLVRYRPRVSRPRKGCWLSSLSPCGFLNSFSCRDWCSLRHSRLYYRSCGGRHTRRCCRCCCCCLQGCRARCRRDPRPPILPQLLRIITERFIVYLFPGPQSGLAAVHVVRLAAWEGR